MFVVAGCAVVQELPDGSRRVTGLVSVTIPNAIDSEKRGADAFELRTLGVSLISISNLTSVTLGYSSDRFTAVRNNALVEFQEKERNP
jgi:hypothetical protein